MSWFYGVLLFRFSCIQVRFNIILSTRCQIHTFCYDAFRKLRKLIFDSYQLIERVFVIFHQATSFSIRANFRIRLCSHFSFRFRRFISHIRSWSYLIFSLSPAPPFGGSRNYWNTFFHVKFNLRKFHSAFSYDLYMMRMTTAMKYISCRASD